MPTVTASPPRVVVFAGPNGAGKSTHAEAVLAALGIEVFVNADYIAKGLSGRNTDAVAVQVASQAFDKRTITEVAIWQKLQKLSKAD